MMQEVIPSGSNSATLLILRISDESLLNSSFSAYAIAINSAASTHTRRLYIYLINPILNCSQELRAQNWSRVQTLSTFIYSTALHTAPSADIVVLFDGWSGMPQLFQEKWRFIFSNYEEEIHRIFGDSNITVKVITDPEVTFIEKAEENTPVNQDIPNQNEQCAIPVVTVNGTFDHLHHGHKNHLTMAAWLASEVLLCSVSPDDNSLYERKKYSTAMQSYAARVAAVERFFRLVKHTENGSTGEITIKCVPKTSKLGAQASEANVQAAVLSTESSIHSSNIVQSREKEGLPHIDIFIIDVVAPRDDVSTMAVAAADKLSSSKMRKALMDRHRTVVLVNGHAGVGKHTIAIALGRLIDKSRVIDNHLLVDLADALCSRSNSGYSSLRADIRRLVMNHIITNEDEVKTYIFTANFSTSFLGVEGAKHFQDFAAQIGAMFIPIRLHCSREELKKRVASPSRHLYSRGKLTDPIKAEALYDEKIVFRFGITEELELEISGLSAQEAADTVLKHIRSLESKFRLVTLVDAGSM